jgi:hypothetical protein
MRIRLPHFFLLLTLLTSFFAAGVADVAFNDVVPLRPYDLTLRQVGSIAVQNVVQKTGIGNSMSAVFTVLFIILIVASVAGAVANSTTGIVIAHQGFTPNPNLTASPGIRNTVPVLPLVFIGVGIGFALDEMGGIL